MKTNSRSRPYNWAFIERNPSRLKTTRAVWAKRNPLQLRLCRNCWSRDQDFLISQPISTSSVINVGGHGFFLKILLMSRTLYRQTGLSYVIVDPLNSTSNSVFLFNFYEKIMVNFFYNLITISDVKTRTLRIK